MGYMHISNLNKNDTVLMFKQVWATEKVDGSSAHVSWDPIKKEIVYFPGCANLEPFKEIFDSEFEKRFMDLVDRGGRDIGTTVFGEVYGGKIQGMYKTYGKQMKFIVFEVKVGDCWLNFDAVRSISSELKLDVVPGRIIDCTEEALTEYRNSPSEVAVMNGCGSETDRFGKTPPQREGIVLRPLVEMRTNGSRVIAKFKNPDFAERKSKADSNFKSEEEIKMLEDAKSKAEEWITPVRLNHVLDALGIREPKIEDLGRVMPAVIEDVIRESGYGDDYFDKHFRKIAGKFVVLEFKKLVGIV